MHDEDWPGVQVRALKNAGLMRWHGRSDALQTCRAEALARLEDARSQGNVQEMDLMAGVGAGRIAGLLPAARIVEEVMAEARNVLSRLGRAADLA